MRGHYRFYCLGAIIAVINITGILWIHHDLTAAQPMQVRVASILPKIDADEAKRLTIIFDRNIAGTGLVGLPPVLPLFDITPKPKGKWLWAAQDRLDFVLEEKLPPGRTFTISAVDDASGRLGRELVGERKFQVTTKRLNVEECNVRTSDDSNVTFELKFNQPVDPESLLQKLEIYDGKKPGKFRADILTRKPNRNLVVRTGRPASDRLHVRIDKTLTGSEGDRSLKDNFVQKLKIMKTFSLLRSDTYVGKCGHPSTVWLYFNRNLKEKQKPEIKVSPGVENLEMTVHDDCISLCGPFVSGKHYTAVIPQTVLASDNTPLGEEQSAAFVFSDRPTSVAFDDGHGILMPGGNLTLDLKTVNTEKVRVRVWRVHENNLVSHLHQNYSSETSRKIAEKEYAIDLPRNTEGNIGLDLRKLVGGQPGIYKIIANVAGSWHSTQAVVTISDIALTVKKHRNGTTVWATSLRTAKPLEGVKVRAVSKNNQILDEALTEGDGTVTLTVPTNHPDGKIWLVTATKGQDTGYILPEKSSRLLYGADIGGRSLPENYEVMLYSDRGVYRPGETIHMSGIIRDHTGQAPEPFPLEIEVIRPDGKKILEKIVEPEADALGMFHTDIPTRQDGHTGPYIFRATLPGDRGEVLGSTHALLEAYVPLRWEVKTTTAKKHFHPDENAALNVSARYLWDKPASELPVRTEAVYQRIDFRSATLPQYSFGVETDLNNHESSTIHGSLDLEGKASIRFQDEDLPPCGLWRGRFSATVTEHGGRSVTSAATATIDRAGRHVGLLLNEGKIVQPGSIVELKWAVRTADDHAAGPGELEYSLHSVQYETVTKEINGRPVWKSVPKTTKIDGYTIPAYSTKEGSGTIFLRCPGTGLYRAEVRDIKTGAVNRLSFYASSEQESQQVSMTDPELVEIVMDKKMYDAGSKAKILLRSPLPGTAFVTLESDNIHQKCIVRIPEHSAEVELDVPKKMRCGGFVSVTVLRPVDPGASQWLPHRAYGIARLNTTKDHLKMDVDIEAPDRLEPGQSAIVTVRTNQVDRVPVVHLWAVDEGILMAANYRQPNPAKFFLAPRASEIRTSDIFSRLLPDHKRPASMRRIGAGGGPFDNEPDEIASLRRSPVPTKLKKPAVVFLASRPAPGGEVMFDIRMPDLPGRMRLMAVAVDNSRYGTGRRNMTLTAPLLVESSWPRFAAPGDTFDVPVKIFNSTGSEKKAGVVVDIDGPVTLAGNNEDLPVHLPVNRPAILWLKATAGKVAGPVDVRIHVQSGNLAARTTSRLTVRPGTPLHCDTQLMRFDAGKRMEFDSPAGFIEDTAGTKVIIGPGPDSQLGPAMDYLLDYPYGCVEQTTSRLYGILHAPKLIEKSGKTKRAAMARDMIRAGIDRLWSMQTLSGGLSYWPGDTQDTLWGSCYAALFLAEAKKTGIEIDKRFSGPLVKYLGAKLSSRGEVDERNTQAMICRILAEFGSPRHGWMENLADNLKQLDTAGRAHLAGAFMAAGRKDRAEAILEKDTIDMRAGLCTIGRLTSPVRQDAVLLSVMVDLNRQHPWVDLLAMRIEKSRTNGRWNSTLDSSSALAALGRYATTGKESKADFSGTVIAAGGRSAPFDSSKQSVLKFPGNGRMTIQSSGSGSIFLVRSTRGLCQPGLIKPYDRGLKVRRKWTNRKGDPIDPAAVRVGDQVFVEVTLASMGGAELGNIAVVDALAGGLEVENPRLGGTAISGRDANIPGRVEFLDDRVILFATAAKETKTFCYSLRATTAGRFSLPPVQAACMYDESTASLGEGGTVTVSR